MQSTEDLTIEGMTCASCAVRVERQLNKLDGVTASVNLATETATVTFPAAIPLADLITAVNQAGYTATPQAARISPALREPRRSSTTLTPRLLISLVLAVPVVLLAMTPHFPGWAWLSLVLATPVAGWGAWPFHRAAVANARHGVATMDTLISSPPRPPPSGGCAPWARARSCSPATTSEPPARSPPRSASAR